MSKDYCLSLDKPVEAEINKVLNAYRNAYKGHHSETDQADYDGMSDAAFLNDPFRPTREDIKESVLDNPLSSGLTDVDDTLEFNLHKNTPFYEFYRTPKGAYGNATEFGRKRLAIQQEFVLIGGTSTGAGVLSAGTLVAFDLSYNELLSYASPSTPELNDFLSLYDSLASICPEDFEKETETLYKKSLVEYFQGKKVLELVATRAVPFTLNSVTAKKVALESTAAFLDAEKAFKALEDYIEDRLETEVENIFAEVKLYQEQCFVLSQITSLIEFKKNNLDLYPRLPYVNYYVTQTTGTGKRKLKSLSQ